MFTKIYFICAACFAPKEFFIYIILIGCCEQGCVSCTNFNFMYQFQTKTCHFPHPFSDLAPVVQRPDNLIRWIRHYSGSKIYFTLNILQGFRTLLTTAWLERANSLVQEGILKSLHRLKLSDSDLSTG